MSQPPSNSHDKTIVERRVAHEGDKSRQAVRDLRAGLGTHKDLRGDVSGGFVADLLRRHARLQQHIGLATPILFALAAFLAQFTISRSIVVLWVIAGLGVGMANFMLARKYLNYKSEELLGHDWNQHFVIFQLMLGVIWAAIFAIHPLHTENGGISLFAMSALLCVIFLGLINARYLKYGTLIASLPAAVVVGPILLMDMTFASLAIVLLMIATIATCENFGSIVRDNHIESLKSQAERDQLVMELEASRSISEEARRRAEEANLAKSRFLATMSHELRTPLNAILGFSEVMTNEVMGPIDNKYYKEYLGDIHRSGSHLLKLINEILDLSRVEAGRYELNEEATSLAYAAEESQQMIKLKASQKNVDIVMQIQPDMPQIWADARSIRQVILNLLSNALKFTPSGGTIWLKVGWTAGGGQYVSIKDTGPGIPAEEIPIVLSSFGQGSIAIKSAEQGTGLGLPIVQALVHMHDGHFDLKSKLREGTEVVATFPKTRVMEVMPAVPVTKAPDARGGLSFRRATNTASSPA